MTEQIPLAPRIPASVNEPIPEPTAELSPGTTWNIRNIHKAHKALKLDAIKEIESDQTIPAHWKSALLEEIRLLNCTAVEVHAHTQFANGFILSVHIKPIF